jgi:hypothetical protein
MRLNISISRQLKHFKAPTRSKQLHQSPTFIYTQSDVYEVDHMKTSNGTNSRISGTMSGMLISKHRRNGHNSPYLANTSLDRSKKQSLGCHMKCSTMSTSKHRKSGHYLPFQIFSLTSLSDVIIPSLAFSEASTLTLQHHTSRYLLLRPCSVTLTPQHSSCHDSRERRPTNSCTVLKSRPA